MLPKAKRLLHEMLERIADKWTLLVLFVLEEEGELRFSHFCSEGWAASARRC